MAASKKKAQKRPAGKARAAQERRQLARALALILTHGPDSKEAREINRRASDLGGAIGNASTVDFRPEYMLAELLADYDRRAFDLAGQDRARAERAYNRLRALAGGDAALVARLSAILADPERAGDQERIRELICELTTAADVGDTHPEVFPGLMRVLLREARRKSEGAREPKPGAGIEQIERWACGEHVRELEAIAGE